MPPTRQNTSEITPGFSAFPEYLDSDEPHSIMVYGEVIGPERMPASAMKPASLTPSTSAT
jgi:hypothetical protein